MILASMILRFCTPYTLNSVLRTTTGGAAGCVVLSVSAPRDSSFCIAVAVWPDGEMVHSPAAASSEGYSFARMARYLRKPRSKALCWA